MLHNFSTSAPSTIDNIMAGDNRTRDRFTSVEQLTSLSPSVLEFAKSSEVPPELPRSKAEIAAVSAHWEIHPDVLHQLFRGAADQFFKKLQTLAEQADQDTALRLLCEAQTKRRTDDKTDTPGLRASSGLCRMSRTPLADLTPPRQNWHGTRSSKRLHGDAFSDAEQSPASRSRGLDGGVRPQTRLSCLTGACQETSR